MSNISPFYNWQEHAKTSLYKLAKPTKKNEEWRYSDLSLLNEERKTAPKSKSLNQPNNSTLLLDEGLSQHTNLPTGVSVLTHKDTDFKTQLDKFIQQNDFDKKYQITQNYAHCNQAFYIKFAVSCQHPIKLLIESNSTKNILLLIEVADHVQIEIIEQFTDLNHSHLNFVSKIKLGNNAKVKHSKLHQFNHQTTFLYSANILAAQNTNYDKCSLNLGCASYREFIQCDLTGTESNVNLLGINYSHQQDKNDIILISKHMADQSKSYQKYFHVLNDKATSSFYGRVIVPPNLAQLEAHQLNKNILLSERAKAFSRPELQIYSDDIKCSHGSTIGNIDKNALYYMQSRGLNVNSAKKLFMQGFLKSILDEFNCHQDTAQYLQDTIKNKVVL
jgi:Fe-S cluster assembly protein SufD